MDNTLISIIVPVYKVEQYLESCVQSLLNQTYPNIEIVLVDDGSPDRCPQLCDVYAGKYKNVHVIHKSNGGLSDARNVGVCNSQGDFIAFVDSDDIVSDHYIEYMYKALRETNSDMAVCNLCEFTEDRPVFTEEYLGATLYSGREMMKNFTAPGMDVCTVVACSKLYPRRIFQQIKFPVGKLHEDEFTAHVFLDSVERVAYVDADLYGYYRRSNSITTDRITSRKLDGLEARIQRLEFIIGKNYDELVGNTIDACIDLLIQACKNRRRADDKATYMERLQTQYTELRAVILTISCRKDLKYALACGKTPTAFFAVYRVTHLAARFVRKFRHVMSELRWLKRGIRALFKIAKASRAIKNIGPCIYFIATPEHGNLGDQAIVYSQKQFLSDVGMRANIIEVTENEYDVARMLFPKLIKKQDILMIDGGGNIGTLWPESENRMRDIVRRFPNNAIFIMPQTAFFSRDRKGREQFEKTLEIYSAHKDLTLFCRDRITYDMFKDHINKSYYVPDMVLYLDNAHQNVPRSNKVLLCLRKDKERITADSQEIRLKEHLTSLGYMVEETDTVVQGWITASERDQALKEKWTEWSAARFVITDRLHGMIFSAITGTPCLALDNISHKVRDGYEWITYLEYILLADDSDLVREIHTLAKISDFPREYCRGNLNPYYEEMKKMILQRLC